MLGEKLKDLAGCDRRAASVLMNDKPKPVLIVVEGAHDVDFLCGLTKRLRLDDSTFPALAVVGANRPSHLCALWWRACFGLVETLRRTRLS
jgi:hypothetical protein